MMTRLPKTARLAAIALMAAATWTCHDANVTGPRLGLPSRAALNLVPSYDIAAGGPSFRLTKVRATVTVFPTGERVLDTVANFATDASDLRLELSLVLTEPSKQFFLRLAAIDSTGDTLFRAIDTVVVRQPSAAAGTPDPVAVPLEYAGPDTAVATLHVSPRDTLLTVGDSVKMRVRGLKTDGTQIPDVRVGWTTGDATKARISSAGTLYAVTAFTDLWVFARTARGTVDSTKMSSRIATASVVVSPPSASMAVGTTKTFTAVVKDAGGNVLSRPVTWASSDTTKADVSPSGVVRAKKPGAVTITAANEGKTGEAAVTVTLAPQFVVDSVRLTPNPVTSGDTVYLVYSITNVGGASTTPLQVYGGATDDRILPTDTSTVVEEVNPGQGDESDDGPVYLATKKTYNSVGAGERIKDSLRFEVPLSADGGDFFFGFVFADCKDRGTTPEGALRACIEDLVAGTPGKAGTIAEIVAADTLIGEVDNIGVDLGHVTLADLRIAPSDIELLQAKGERGTRLRVRYKVSNTASATGRGFNVIVGLRDVDAQDQPIISATPLFHERLYGKSSLVIDTSVFVPGHADPTHTYAVVVGVDCMMDIDSDETPAARLSRCLSDTLLYSGVDEQVESNNVANIPVQLLMPDLVLSQGTPSIAIFAAGTPSRTAVTRDTLLAGDSVAVILVVTNQGGASGMGFDLLGGLVDTRTRTQGVQTQLTQTPVFRIPLAPLLGQASHTIKASFIVPSLLSGTFEFKFRVYADCKFVATTTTVDPATELARLDSCYNASTTDRVGDIPETNKDNNKVEKILPFRGTNLITDGV